jgi:hypothetical protein
MKDKKTIYELKLHESMSIDEDLWVLRVPGGWVYRFYEESRNKTERIFVPFDCEFQYNNY